MVPEYSMKDIPFELNKKVTLLMNFKTYMEGGDSKKNEPKFKLS